MRRGLASLALALVLAACATGPGIDAYIAPVGDGQFVLVETGDAAMPVSTAWSGDEVSAGPWRFTQAPSDGAGLVVSIANPRGQCLETPAEIGAPMKLSPCADSPAQHFRVAGFSIALSGSSYGLVDVPTVTSLLRHDGFVIRALSADGCVARRYNAAGSPDGVILQHCEDFGGWTRFRGGRPGG